MQLPPGSIEEAVTSSVVPYTIISDALSNDSYSATVSLPPTLMFSQPLTSSQALPDATQEPLASRIGKRDGSHRTKVMRLFIEYNEAKREYLEVLQACEKLEQTVNERREEVVSNGPDMALGALVMSLIKFGDDVNEAYLQLPAGLQKELKEEVYRIQSFIYDLKERHGLFIV